MSSPGANAAAPEPSLGKPTTQLLLARVFNFVPVFVISVVTARSLGVDALGQFAYALGIAAIFGLIPNLGIGTIVTRAIAAGDEDAGALYRGGMRLQLLLSASIVVIAPLFAAALPSQQVRIGYVALAAVQVGLNCVSWTLLAPAVARMKYSRIAAASSISALATLAFVLAAAVLGGQVVGFLWARIFGAGVSLVAGWFTVRGLVPEATTGTIGMRGMLRRTGPMALSNVIFTLYERIDTVLLGQLASTAAVGLYNVAYKPTNAGKFVGHTLGAAALPVVARSTGSTPPRQYTRILRALGVLGPGIALAFTGVARDLIVLVYGAQFTDAAPVAAVLVWSLAAAWIYICISNALVARDHVRVWTTVLAGALTINFATNLWAIPRWGALGAASTTLATDVLAIVAGSAATWILLGFKPDFVRVAKICAAIALGGGTLLLLDLGAPPLTTVAALAVYSATLFVSRAVTWSDARQVQGWLISALTGRTSA